MVQGSSQLHNTGSNVNILYTLGITTLHSQQLQLLSCNTAVCHHIQLHANHGDLSLIHIIVCGTAGTGKPYLISAIAQTLGNGCVKFSKEFQRTVGFHFYVSFFSYMYVKEPPYAVIKCTCLLSISRRLRAKYFLQVLSFYLCV